MEDPGDGAVGVGGGEKVVEDVGCEEDRDCEDEGLGVCGEERFDESHVLCLWRTAVFGEGREARATYTSTCPLC